MVNNNLITLFTNIFTLYRLYAIVALAICIGFAHWWKWNGWSPFWEGIFVFCVALSILVIAAHITKRLFIIKNKKQYDKNELSKTIEYINKAQYNEKEVIKKILNHETKSLLIRSEELDDISGCGYWPLYQNKIIKILWENIVSTLPPCSIS